MLTANRNEGGGPAGAGRDWVRILAQLLVVLIVLAALGFALKRLATILSPVLISMLVAYVLDPAIDWFERRGLGRVPALLMLSVASLGVTVAFAILVLPTLAGEVSAALAGLPALAVDAVEWAQGLGEKLGVTDSQLDQSLEGIAGAAQDGVMTVAGAAVSAASSLLNLVLIPLFVFYFARDFDELKRKPLRLIPQRFHEGVTTRAARMDAAIGGWIRGQVQVAIVLAVLYAVCLGVIGVRMGVVIGIVAGLLNVVPYFGFAVGLALGMLMAAIHGGSAQVIAVGVSFIVVQTVEQYVITPKLVGEKVGMSPVMVIVVLLVGGSLFGFFGLLLAIPAYAAGSVLAAEAVEHYRAGDWFVGDVVDGPVADAVIEAPVPE